LVSSFRAFIGEDRLSSSPFLMSTRIWSIAYWLCWLIVVQARSWSFLSVDLDASLSDGWAG
jgi:hypothetical protein